jgi:hypothetical protein
MRTARPGNGYPMVGQPFPGRTFFIAPRFSEATAAESDDEFRRVVDGAHQRSRDIALAIALAVSDLEPRPPAA